MTSTLSHILRYLLAAMPILVLLGLMIGLRWGVQKAGPFSWLVCLAVSALAFGLTFDVWWVSQARGVLLALYVLAVLWPALLLFNIVDRTGGIRALAEGLGGMIGDRSLLLVVIAWAFSGALEGLAGFGLPVAVVSPMLVALGVQPVLAVAAVAVGHAWSVTFGDMGVIFQTLMGVTQMSAAQLAPPAAVLVGAACMACGLAVTRILGDGTNGRRLIPAVLGLGLLMAVVQYGLAVGGLYPLAAFGAGLAGVGAAAVFSRKSTAPKTVSGLPSRALIGVLGSYGGLAVLMSIIAWPGPVRSAISPTVLQVALPEVVTTAGFITPAGMGQAFRPWVHPGSAILVAALLTYAAFRWACLSGKGDFSAAARSTWRSAAPASLGILATVGLSTMMEHSGMTQLLAEGLAGLMGAVFPLVSPLVGILGAFATGSNNNSNVLFAPLQKNVAVLLAIDPRLLLAAQTAGGALGSMLAPAKIAVGCSTVGLKGREGEVLRRTVLYGLFIGLLLGMLTLLYARLAGGA